MGIRVVVDASRSTDGRLLDVVLQTLGITTEVSSRWMLRHLTCTRSSASSGTLALSSPLVMTLLRKLAQSSSSAMKSPLPPQSWRPLSRRLLQYSLVMLGSLSSRVRA